MLETPLTNCAHLLYHWIVSRMAEDTNVVKIDLKDFQAWTAEYREKPYSNQELFEALLQLKELELISLSKTEITLKVEAQNPWRFQAQLPTQMLLQEQQTKNHRFRYIFWLILSALAMGLIPIIMILTTFAPVPQPAPNNPVNSLANQEKTREIDNTLAN